MQLTRIARELLDIREDIQMRTNGYSIDDVDAIEIFEQMWGSTALGFGGMGGQAMTSAMTYVVIPEYADGPAYVYFGGRFAYEVKNFNERFKEDIRKGRMASVAERGRYAIKDTEKEALDDKV